MSAVDWIVAWCVVAVVVGVLWVGAVGELCLDDDNDWTTH